MEKQTYSQPDLFNQARESDSSAQRFSGSFLSFIRTYERLVLMFIGFVITGVVCYCVGVEKGKSIALSQTNSKLDYAYRQPVSASQPRVISIREAGPVSVPGSAQINPAGVLKASVVNVARSSQQALPAAKPLMREKPAVPPVLVSKIPAVQGAYTIQIATYQARSNAQQEIDSLKKQGLLPVLKPSGSYVVLCVGNFPDQQTARSLLTQLKRKYRDCYIRRL